MGVEYNEIFDYFANNNEYEFEVEIEYTDEKVYLSPSYIKTYFIALLRIYNSYGDEIKRRKIRSWVYVDLTEVNIDNIINYIQDYTVDELLENAEYYEEDESKKFHELMEEKRKNTKLITIEKIVTNRKIRLEIIKN